MIDESILLFIGPDRRHTIKGFTEVRVDRRSFYRVDTLDLSSGCHVDALLNENKDLYICIPKKNRLKIIFRKTQIGIFLSYRINENSYP